MLSIEDLRKMTVDELDKELNSSKRELYKVRLDIVSGQEKRNHLVRLNKKYIAEILTVKTQKELKSK